MMETTRPLSTLYGEVADRVLVLIEQGTYKAGDKVPSIRSLSTSLGVSVNTVKEAYILLESQRFLEARPQSGYYVRRKVPPLPAAGKATPPLAKLNPMVSSICRIYGEITQNRADVGASSLAVAIPDPAFLPMAGLNRAFAAALKDGITNSGDYLFGPGYEALRTHVARHSIESGLTLSPDDIIITAGASEAISLSILALCKPGETVVVETPTYFNFLSLPGRNLWH